MAIIGNQGGGGISISASINQFINNSLEYTVPANAVFKGYLQCIYTTGSYTCLVGGTIITLDAYSLASNTHRRVYLELGAGQQIIADNGGYNLRLNGVTYINS